MTSRENRDESFDNSSFDSSQDSEVNRTSATVVALFIDRDDASDAIADLREAGFGDDDIGVAFARLDKFEMHRANGEQILVND